MMFTVPFVDALYYPKFAAQLVAGFNDILAERALQDKVTITVTGFMTIAGETFNLLFISMARSYSLAFLLVAILLVLLIGELRLGLVSLIPNLTPIVVVLGAMGLLGIPLDISSMLLGGILIGIAVDDTIHFAHNFNRYHRETGCPEKAITLTLQTAGRAMLVTSLVLVVGFFILTAASLNNIILFGWICGFGVMLAFLADVIVMPSLVALVDPCSGRNQS